MRLGHGLDLSFRATALFTLGIGLDGGESLGRGNLTSSMIFNLGESVILFVYRIHMQQIMFPNQ